MKVLKMVENGITLEELIKIAKENNLPMDTKISIMGTETAFVMEDKGYILLDEKNCAEEL